MDVHYSTKTNEWETPQDIFDKLNEMFGPFTLDPCATAENAKCAQFFTEQDDGLKQDWGGHTVFMNPPYGRAIKHWIAKAHEAASLYFATVVCLIPARTDTTYWHDHIMQAGEVYLLRGRIKFVGGKSSAPFPSCVAIFYPGGSKPPPRFSAYDLKAKQWERWHEDDDIRG